MGIQILYGKNRFRICDKIQWDQDSNLTTGVLFFQVLSLNESVSRDMARITYFVRPGGRNRRKYPPYMAGVIHEDDDHLVRPTYFAGPGAPCKHDPDVLTNIIKRMSGLQRFTMVLHNRSKFWRSPPKQFVDDCYVITRGGLVKHTREVTVSESTTTRDLHFSRV